MNVLEEVDEYYSGRAPSGSARDGYSTYEEPAGTPLAEAVRTHLTRLEAEKGKKNPEWVVRGQTKNQPLKVTVHACWSGYSEYTITNTWTEASIEWGPYALEFESMAELFRTLADAEAEGMP